MASDQFIASQLQFTLCKNKDGTLHIFSLASWFYPKLCQWSAMERHYRKRNFYCLVLVCSCCKLPQAYVASPAPSSCNAGTFFSNWPLLYMVVSTNQPPAASAGVPLRWFCSRAPPVGNLPMNRFPRHPRGWISSKFYQHSATVTSLPSKVPRLAILSPIRSTVEERASLGSVPCFKPRGRGCSLYLLFLCSSEFSLLPNSQPSSK